CRHGPTRRGGEGSAEARSRVNPPRDEWGRAGTASIAWVPIHDERDEERAMNIVSTGTRRNASLAG
ncbi:hypothetical protein, partial [Burkholderia cepacia]|uniref:hypothetical protein n=1 Tax=Burkholderia cepacia TaxID=292 RepID=UPI00197EFA21